MQGYDHGFQKINIDLSRGKGIVLLQTKVNDFVYRLNDNRSLRPLYKTSALRVMMQSGRERYLLMFSRNGCQLEDQGKADKMDVMIAGTEEALEKVLAGQERLLMMKKRKLITADGTYRRLLKLESLFILNGTERYWFYKRA